MTKQSLLSLALIAGQLSLPQAAVAGVSKADSVGALAWTDLPGAMKKARELAANPTPAVMLVKQLLADNPSESRLDLVMEREQVRDRIARKWPEHAEALSAFNEKREPKFFDK